jgi:hypothetical protein
MESKTAIPLSYTQKYRYQSKPREKTDTKTRERKQKDPPSPCISLLPPKANHDDDEEGEEEEREDKWKKKGSPKLPQGYLLFSYPASTQFGWNMPSRVKTLCQHRKGFRKTKLIAHLM